MNTDISIDELEFYATQSIRVTILPNFNEGEIYLLCQSFGPFKANQEVDVPFWLAINLKQKHKCSILPPEWINTDWMANMLEMEKKDQRVLCRLPHDSFFQICYVFIRKAADNLKGPNKLRILVSDIQEARNRKINKLFTNVKGPIRINNITLFEINKRREPMIKTIDAFQKMVKTEKE